MPKQSREQIIAELNGRKIGYSEDMSYNELCELLRQAERPVGCESPLGGARPPSPLGPGPGGAPKPEDLSAVRVEEPIDYSNIRCGLSTIHDLHRRITILERKANA